MIPPQAIKSDIFNSDIRSNKGYLYTTRAGLSSYLANLRLTDAALSAFAFNGKNILDSGCGDGTYTIELFRRGRPALIEGIDSADEAIKTAAKRIDSENIKFRVGRADSLPYTNNNFDLVHLRGILHHLDTPFQAIKESLRVAPQILIIEPNGYNIVLKIIEKLSPYHRSHGEKSFSTRKLERWISDSGGKIVSIKYVGLVPFFCPSFLARALKFFEPIIEIIPVINLLFCGVQIIIAERR